MEPDAEHQALVMSAIYGPTGVKARHTAGVCASELQSDHASCCPSNDR